MAFDEQLEARIGAALEREQTDYEKKYMFGGVAFMVRGHMAVGIVKDDLMVRVGAEAHESSLEAPHTRPMDFAGRPMKGMIYVAPDGTRSDAELARWVSIATSYAKTQPVKEKKPKKKAAKKKAAGR
jgi:TfoX/Sxy family transcriptional regulator of competence genes